MKKYILLSTILLSFQISLFAVNNSYYSIEGHNHSNQHKSLDLNTIGDSSALYQSQQSLDLQDTVIHKSLLYPTQKGGIGLVLSGGGAKGLYHVGIIKALEENDITIDYVAGASMGAIVGSMYASGWSPERMWNFFLTDSVSTWLTGKIPDKYRGYYLRFDPTAEMVGINLIKDTTTSKNVVQLPTNLISPYLIDLAFIDLLGPASAAANNNFDSLMVPFRCVASDVYKKDLVVFDKGLLPFAVRASMTIPLVFRPLQMDSTLLFDGGVMNNFPWQTLQKDFNPSHYIGGICTDNFDNPAQNNVIGQVMVLLTRMTDYNLPDTTKDVSIARLMPDIGVLDYSKAAIVMQYGYDDAMAQMEQIKQKIHSRTTKKELDKKRADFIDRIPELAFDSVRIEGLTHQQELYVRRQLGLHLHKNFTFEYFYDKYLRILSAEVFTGQFPRLEYDQESGFYRLSIKMATKQVMRFSLGGNISSSSLNQGYVAFDYRHTTSVSSSYRLQGNFGMFHNGIKVGGRHDFYSNFPFYIDYNFSYGDFNYDGSNMEPYYRNKDWRFKKQENLIFTTSVSIPVFGNSAFKGRAYGGRTKYQYFETLHTSVDQPSNSKFKFFAVNLEVETSTLNYAQYANQGKRQLVSVQFINGWEDYTPGTVTKDNNLTNQSNRWWIEARYTREQYLPITKWFTLGYLFDVTASNHHSFSNALSSYITSPRFEPTPQMRTMFMTEFASPSYIGMGVMPTFNLLGSQTFYLKTYAYAFIPQDIVLVDKTWYAPTVERLSEFTKFVFGGSLIYQTPIGPASLTLTKYTTGKDNWCFQFNFGYTLFKNIRF